MIDDSFVKIPFHRFFIDLSLIFMIIKTIPILISRFNIEKHNGFLYSSPTVIYAREKNPPINYAASLFQFKFIIVKIWCKF